MRKAMSGYVLLFSVVIDWMYMLKEKKWTKVQ